MNNYRNQMLLNKILYPGHEHDTNDIIHVAGSEFMAALEDVKFKERLENEMKNVRNYDRIAIMKTNEVLKHIVLNKSDPNAFKDYKDFYGIFHEVKMFSQRYQVFKKSLCCSECGIEGSYFAMEKNKQQLSNRYHFNLYAMNANDEEVLMTKDHIIPRAKGGKNILSNYQTMCQPCNLEKADKLVDIQNKK